MCVKEFCCCWSPTFESEGPKSHEASPKFKRTNSGDLPEKAASTIPFSEKAPKKIPEASKSNEKVTSEEVHPSSLVAATGNYDSEEPATKPKAQPATEAVPKVPAKFSVEQQPQAKIEHEDIASTGEFTAKGRTKTTDAYMAGMKAKVGG